MAKPPDRVQVLKQEIAADGGDPLDGEEGYPAPVDSTEDAIQAAGFFLGESGQAAGDEAVGGYREANKLILFDSETPAGVDLSTLKATGSGGEINTASNIGDGADIFSAKVGVDLQFRGIKAASSKLSALVSGDNVEVDASSAAIEAEQASSPRPPNGAASGDLSASYPASTVAKLLNVPLDFAGIADDYILRYDSGSASFKAEALGAAPTVADVMQLEIGIQQNAPSSWASFGAFIYGGSLSWGTPTSIKVLAENGNDSGSKRFDVRIYDVTHAQVIAQLPAPVQSDGLAIFTLDTPANIPTAEAVWEVQVVRDGAVASTLIAAVSVKMN